MRFSIWFLLAGLLLCGCARSTIESRKQDRYGAYAGLPEETRGLVDEGKIAVGMSMDAVYIAWGRPDQILEAQGTDGVLTTTWLYSGTFLEEHRYWSYRPIRHGRTWYDEPYLAHDHYPRSYVSSEVRFEKGVVKEWRHLPRPTY